MARQLPLLAYDTVLQNCIFFFSEETSRAVVKREYLMIIRDNFCQLCMKPYDVTPHLNRLVETVQLRGHNIWFQ